jgi:hypothetical protein
LAGWLWDETLAALGTTCVDHGTTAARFHARTETVSAGVLEIAWLKSALGGHDDYESGDKEAEF